MYMYINIGKKSFMVYFYLSKLVQILMNAAFFLKSKGNCAEPDEILVLVEFHLGLHCLLVSGRYIIKNDKF